MIKNIIVKLGSIEEFDDFHLHVNEQTTGKMGIQFALNNLPPQMISPNDLFFQNSLAETYGSAIKNLFLNVRYSDIIETRFLNRDHRCYIFINKYGKFHFISLPYKNLPGITSRSVIVPNYVEFPEKYIVYDEWKLLQDMEK